MVRRPLKWEEYALCYKQQGCPSAAYAWFSRSRAGSSINIDCTWFRDVELHGIQNLKIQLEMVTDSDAPRIKYANKELDPNASPTTTRAASVVSPGTSTTNISNAVLIAPPGPHSTMATLVHTLLLHLFVWSGTYSFELNFQVLFPFK